MAMEKAADKNLTGLKKRQQIANTNKMIFLWVAVASIIISSCLVVLQFLVREGIFNQKIINAKNETNRILVQNVTNAAVLKQKVDALVADPNLTSARTTTSNNNLQVVLDALPAQGDATTFANSLQSAILNRAGTSITGITAGKDVTVTETVDGSEAASSGSILAKSIPFSVTLTGSYSQVQNTLKDVERSIRPITITTLTIQGTDTQLTINMGGSTYYLPPKTVKLGTQTIKP